MAAFTVLICVLLFGGGDAHGLLSDPRQRGALKISNHITQSIDVSAPQDYECHFPSGDKSIRPGAGYESVRRDAGYYWTPYEPLNPGFRWRCGVCGDELYGAQHHLRGGKYYGDGRRVRTYEQGSIVFFESEIVTHHNGFYEFYVCDIDRCGNDISARCFEHGHCTRLLRARGPCDSGDHRRCGPIDRNYPGRWYLPCGGTEPHLMGGQQLSLAYLLPPWLTCEHCVIQWYWTAANTCNPPGVQEYFTGPDAPRWGDCRGQGGARGGWSSNKGLCGGEHFPEEYWQCADVRIVPKAHGHHPPHDDRLQGSHAPHDEHSHSGVGTGASGGHHGSHEGNEGLRPPRQTGSSASTGSGVSVGARSGNTSDRRNGGGEQPGSHEQGHGGGGENEGGEERGSREDQGSDGAHGHEGQHSSGEGEGEGERGGDEERREGDGDDVDASAALGIHHTHV